MADGASVQNCLRKGNVEKSADVGFAKKIRDIMSMIENRQDVLKTIMKSIGAGASETAQVQASSRLREVQSAVPCWKLTPLHLQNLRQLARKAFGQFICKVTHQWKRFAPKEQPDVPSCLNTNPAARYHEIHA